MGTQGRTILATARLTLREMTEDDAGFMVELLNDADFLRYIGDRGVRNVADARRYLADGTLASYREHGYGMWLAERRDGGGVVGVCGLVRRPGLDAPDLGYALLPAQRGAGYAAEAARAVLAHAAGPLGIERLVAIVTPDNRASIALLDGLGFARRGEVRLPGGSEDLALYEVRFAESAA